MGRTASSGGELSLAPVVLHVEAMGLVLQFDSKMASNGCTAAYATSFSRTATFEIPRGDLVTLRACVRHLVFLNRDEGARIARERYRISHATGIHYQNPGFSDSMSEISDSGGCQ
jgi:hypothetical protein